MVCSRWLNGDLRPFGKQKVIHSLGEPASTGDLSSALNQPNCDEAFTIGRMAA